MFTRIGRFFKAIFNAIPIELKKAIVIGIGIYVIGKGDGDLSRVTVFESSEDKGLFMAVTVATAIAFFAMVGFEDSVNMVEETKEPERIFPRMMLTGLGISMVIYVLVATVLIGIVPYDRLNVPDPLAVGIDSTGLTWLSPVVKISALFGLFSTMLVTLLGQTRIFFSMSRDGLLPEVFGRVHPRWRTPHLSTAITGVIVAIAAGLLPIGVLSQLVSMGTLLAFVLVSIGVLVLRRARPDLPRPFRTPWTPWVPIFAAAVCLLQMAVLPAATWIRLLIWLALYLLLTIAHRINCECAPYFARRREVLLPVIAATATTVVVVVPFVWLRP